MRYCQSLPHRVPAARRRATGLRIATAFSGFYAPSVSLHALSLVLPSIESDLSSATDDASAGGVRGAKRSSSELVVLEADLS